MDGNECLALRLFPITLRKRDPLTQLMGRPNSQFGSCGEDNILFPLSGMKPGFIGHQFRAIGFIIA
jgi:hypothetical protein